MHLQDIDPFKIINFDDWQNIVDLLCRLAHVRSAAITRIDLPYIEAFKVSKNPDNPFNEGMRVELATHYCEEVVYRKNRVLVANATKSERWSNAPEIRHKLISYMGYPILLPDGEIFGTICIHDDKENNYSDEIDSLLLEFKKIVEAHFKLAMQTKILQEKNKEIRTLRGMLPICSNCKKIRDDEGYWHRLETYIKSHSDVNFTHSICPECAKELYPPDLYPDLNLS